ncbi:MAG TPA: XRE family transcriptional regulator [Sulfurovum sp.]|nr:XRE family transcriptional regulator [Sulfurovum sp.]
MEFYDIAKFVKDARKEKKLTQSELANKVGITRQTLSKLENGSIDKVSLQLFIKILEGLDLEMNISEKKPFYYFDSTSI